MRFRHALPLLITAVLLVSPVAVARSSPSAQHGRFQVQQQQEQQLQKQEQQHVAHHRLRSAAPAAARHLSAADVTCPDGCSPGSCFVNDQGTVQCTQCIDTLVVNRTNGQCGCPMGRYAAAAGSCIDCDKGYYCPGGVYTTKELPARVQCPTYMTTLGRRSASIRACVNLPGYWYDINLRSGVMVASLCPENTYSSGLRKQRACVPCPTGFVTRGKTGSTRPDDCRYPPVCDPINPCANVTNSTGVCIPYPRWISGATFGCVCDPGMSFNIDKNACEDTDGCLNSRFPGCDQVANSTGQCIDVPAPGTGFTCVCQPSFYFNSTNMACLPIKGCPPGFGGPAGGDCSPCPANTFQPGGGITCSACPPPSAAPIGSASCIDTSVAVGGDHVCAIVTPALKPICGRFRASSQAVAPADLTNVISMCAGDNHTCAVSKGVVTCWGSNAYKQSAPPSNLTDAVLVRCGSTFTCAMTASRSVVCFGSFLQDPSGGVLLPEPVPVPTAPVSNVGQLSVGASHVCFTLLQGQTYGESGQAGCFGSLNASAGLGSNAVVDLVAAFQHATCTFGPIGRFQCFGDISSLGGWSFVAAAGSVADVVGGDGFAVARLDSGGLVPWGSAAADLNVPAGLNATAVAAANQTLCVRAADGGVLCFGTGSDYLLETFWVGGRFQSSAAAAAACATYGAQLATLDQLQRDFSYGAEWCSWGFVADVDQAGSPILAYPMQQANVSGCSPNGAKVYTTAAASGTQAAATCFGRKPADVTSGVLPFNLNNWSLLGGRRTFKPPQTCTGLPRGHNFTSWMSSCTGARVGTVCRGGCPIRFYGLPQATCGLSGEWISTGGSCQQLPCGPGTGGLDCDHCPPNWFQKGDSTVCQPCPTGSVSPMGSSMCFDTRLAVGAAHSCVVVGPKQQVVCDGKRVSGQLTPPSNLTGVTSICIGFEHTCAVSNGAVTCWGGNTYGQTQVPPGITDAILVRCGELVACVLTASRQIQCWGKIQVATIASKQILGPVNMSALAPGNIGQLSVGWHHVCVAAVDPVYVGSAGQVYCVGYPNAMDMFPADASTTDILAAFWAVIIMNIRGVNINISGFRSAIGAVPAEARGAVEMTGGNAFALARMKTGALVLWGTGAASMGVPADINATAVATYDSHMCARLSNGTIQCYGLDTDLQHLRESFAVGAGAGFNSATGYADSKAAAAACAVFGAKLATVEQMRRDFNVGADWCGWGFTADVDAAKKSVLAYPAQSNGVAGCSEAGPMLYTSSVLPANTAVLAVCYGKKPAVPVPGLVPFSNTTWSLLAAPSV